MRHKIFLCDKFFFFFLLNDAHLAGRPGDMTGLEHKFYMTFARMLMPTVVSQALLTHVAQLFGKLDTSCQTAMRSLSHALWRLAFNT